MFSLHNIRCRVTATSPLRWRRARTRDRAAKERRNDGNMAYLKDFHPLPRWGREEGPSWHEGLGSGPAGGSILANL